MSQRYGFVKPALITLFSIVDRVGSTLLPRQARTWPDPERLLLVNFAHIGDLLLTTAAIKAIRQRYPDTHLTMLVAPWSADIVRHNPHLDEVITFAPSWWDRRRGSPYFRPMAFWRLVQLIKAGDYDWVVNFKSFFQENLAFALARVPRRVGYGLYGGGFLNTDHVWFRWGAHTVLQHMHLAEMIDAADPQPTLDMFTSEADRQHIDGLLATVAPPLIAIHVGAGYPSKLWPIERYAALTNRLTEQYNGQVILVGGPADLPLIAQMQPYLTVEPLVVAGELSLSQTAALLERCALFIGNDSGPAHMAAAVGTPVVVIFSGENEVSHWRPWGDPVIALQHLPPCGLCGLQICNRDHECMTAISVAQVEAAARQLLQQRARSS